MTEPATLPRSGLPRSGSGPLASAHLGPVRPGGRVALLSTAGVASDQGRERALELVTTLGFEPVLMPTATARHPRADYLAGTDQQRADDFVQAWTDPSIDAIICLRGGYGTVRILDLLDVDSLSAADPKPLFGSSDITALHEWLADNLGVASWFAPMPATRDLLDDPVAIEFYRAALTETWAGRVFDAGSDRRTLVAGEATGRLIGGNLSLLAMTVGAHGRMVDNTGRVVLLEDVGEDIYKYDGYLQTLLRSGWFDGVAGIALGSWKGSDPAEARELCAELLTPLGVPLVSDLDFGHGPGAMTIPLGVVGRLVADDQPRIELVG